MKVLVNGTPCVGGTFFSAMHSLYYRVRHAAFSLLESCLSLVPDFGAAPPPPLLGFCFLAIFSASFRLLFRVVTSDVRATNTASLLDDNPQTWLSVQDRSVYLSNANFRILSRMSEGVGILYSSWAS